MCSNSNHTDSFPCSSPTSSKPLCGFPFRRESVVSVRPDREILVHHIFEAKPLLNNTHLVQKTWTYRQYTEITYSWSIDGTIQRTEKETSGEKTKQNRKGGGGNQYITMRNTIFKSWFSTSQKHPALLCLFPQITDNSKTPRHPELEFRANQDARALPAPRPLTHRHTNVL